MRYEFLNSNGERVVTLERATADQAAQLYDAIADVFNDGEPLTIVPVEE